MGGKQNLVNQKINTSTHARESMYHQESRYTPNLLENLTVTQIHYSKFVAKNNPVFHYRFIKQAGHGCKEEICEQDHNISTVPRNRHYRPQR